MSEARVQSLEVERLSFQVSVGGAPCLDEIKMQHFFR
jgi:hypothetical protein